MRTNNFMDFNFIHFRKNGSIVATSISSFGMWHPVSLEFTLRLKKYNHISKNLIACVVLILYWNGTLYCPGYINDIIIYHHVIAMLLVTRSPHGPVLSVSGLFVLLV